MMDILQIYNVSRETKEKIEAYKTLVLEWNCKFNLISKSSVEHIRFSSVIQIHSAY